MDYVTGETFIIDKPLRWTSFDVVKRLRAEITRRTGLRKVKVGHAGTLDPLATGLMIVVTGRRTKLIETLQSGVKEYMATLALGSTTPSFDLETEIDATYPTDHITTGLIDDVLSRFRGAIEQVPPSFSACKIEGTRAYQLARNGEEVKLKAKTLVIDELERLSFDADAKELTISAVAREFGDALGWGAHLTALRRTRVGASTLDDALDIQSAVKLIAESEVSYPEDFPIPKKSISSHNGK